MSNPIKTRDLCERCKHSGCRDHTDACSHGERSDGCPAFSVFGCRCDSIRENTPCPYYEEGENNE